MTENTSWIGTINGTATNISQGIQNRVNNVLKWGNSQLDTKKDLVDNLKETYRTLFLVPDLQDVGISTTGNVKSGGFSFMITDEESIKLNSNITDYVLENNTMAQSGNTRQPLKIEISGRIGEVLIEAPTVALKGNNIIQASLNRFAGINPSLSIKAQEYYNKVNNTVAKVNKVIEKIENTYDFIKSFGDGNNDTKQKLAYAQLMTMWKEGTPFEIMTYYGRLTNMVIESCSITQGDNKYQTTISLALKQVTYAKTTIRKAKAQEIRKAQLSTTQNNGGIMISKLSELTGVGK